MIQRRSSLGFKIAIGFILSLFFSSLLAIMVSGYLLKKNFDERSTNSSILVSKFIASSMNQYINRLTSGLDALNGDADLLRDIFGSLGSSTPRRKNFFKLHTKVEDFARQYGLEQVSVYLKPMGRKDFTIFSSIVPKENHVFTFSTENYGEDMIEINRDEYGIVSTKENGRRHYDFRFSNAFLGTNKQIGLMRVDGKLYLDINYPLINEIIGSDEHNAFIKKGATYGVVRIAMSLPDSFISELETQTGHRINFYGSNFEYIDGILQPDVVIPQEGSFIASGTDGVEYINYLSAAKFDDLELARIVVSFEKSLLTEKITSMILMIFGINILSSSLLLGGLNFYLRRRVIVPMECLTKSVKSLAEGNLKSWENIAQQELSSESDEIDVLKQAFRLMGQQLDGLVNNLEETVKKRTAQLVTEKQKTQEILHNIGEGIITFDVHLVVGDEYSRHMHSLLDLNAEQIKGSSFNELILDRVNLNADAKNTVQEILRSSLGMEPLSWEVNHANLPVAVELHSKEGEIRYLSLDWYSILNEQGLVERGMLVIKDQTEKILLQRDLEKSNERDERLSEIINVAMKHDMDYIMSFIERAQSQFSRNKVSGFLEQARIKPNNIFVILHTLKGDARTTGFKRIANKAHQAESLLQQFRSKSFTNDDCQNFVEAIDQLIQELSGFSEILSRIFSRDDQNANQSTCLINMLLPQFKEAVSILKDNGIKVGGFHYDDHIQNWCPKNLELIKDMIMHALTNAIDHGYVLPKLEGKVVAEFAMLSVCAKIENESISIEIIDEGYGYDIEKIRQKYNIRRDIGDEEALSVLFESGVTTASEVTTSSGRGVGLNAIKEISGRLGGTAKLEANLPRGAKVIITLPMREILLYNPNQPLADAS